MMAAMRAGATTNATKRTNRGSWSSCNSWFVESQEA